MHVRNRLEYLCTTPRGLSNGAKPRVEHTTGAKEERAILRRGDNKKAEAMRPRNKYLEKFQSVDIVLDQHEPNERFKCRPHTYIGHNVL